MSSCFGCQKNCLFGKKSSVDLLLLKSKSMSKSLSKSLSMSRSCVHDIKTKLFAKLPSVPAKFAVNLLDHELFACFVFSYVDQE